MGIRTMSGGKRREAVELENTKTGERRTDRTRGLFHDWHKALHDLAAGDRM
jgi:hypothetical protein